MAPEVMGKDNYDIWSLGIVCIEICIGKPSLSQYCPMQAVFIIPKNPAAKTPECRMELHTFSNELVEFIAKCLQKVETKCINVIGG